MGGGVESFVSNNFYFSIIPRQTDPHSPLSLNSQLYFPIMNNTENKILNCDRPAQADQIVTLPLCIDSLKSQNTLTLWNNPGLPGWPFRGPK